VGSSYRRDVRAATSSLVQTLGIAVEGAVKSWITLGGSSETATSFYTGTGVGATAEDRVPILIARRQTTATASAWAVALTGAAAPLVTPSVSPPRTTPPSGRARPLQRASPTRERVAW